MPHASAYARDRTKREGAAVREWPTHADACVHVTVSRFGRRWRTGVIRGDVRDDIAFDERAVSATEHVDPAHVSQLPPANVMDEVAHDTIVATAGALSVAPLPAEAHARIAEVRNLILLDCIVLRAVDEHAHPLSKDMAAIDDA